MNAVIIIPTIDPTSRLVELVDELNERGFTQIVTVDDGSERDAQAVFQSLEQRGVRVLYHAVNLGKGQAIKTGLMYVRHAFPEATHFVTMDDDGQHLPCDVETLCQVAGDYPDRIVLGIRDLHSSDVPARSRLGNAFSSLYFKIDTGMACPDTQTGLRAIPMAQLPLALSTPGSRYDYEMNFLTTATKKGIPVAMVPVTTVYEDNNEASHFSPVRDSLLIYKQLFRFAGSSLACACVDLGLFALITTFVNLEVALLVVLATAIARIASGVLNFALNRTWSFTDSGSKQGSMPTQAMRYLVLFASQMIASMTLVTALAFLPVPLAIVKILVDSALFVISYFVQRNWVFKPSAHAQALIVKGGSHAPEGSRASFPVA